MDKKPVTRKDIAELCEVSISVVSRALNNSGYVEESKRKKIIATAERLGYVPQPVAMSLQERRTKQLLYYCKDLNNEYYLDMYRGMCQAANERGYLVTVSSVMAFERIKDTMVDGIIMPNEDMTSYYMKKGGKNYYLPIVSASFCNVADIPKSVPLVETDMYKAMEIALNYLNSTGHKIIAYGFPYDMDNPNSRYLAYKDYIRKMIQELYRFPRIYRDIVCIRRKISLEKESLQHRFLWNESWMRQQSFVSMMNLRLE